jgi:hypothetical protein
MTERAIIKNSSDLWYPMVCNDCGYRASSEHFIEQAIADTGDYDVLCPRLECHSSNTEEDYTA